MVSVRAVEVTIRNYERRDAAAVADVFYRSVRQVVLSDYTAEQVKTWVFFERKGFTVLGRQDKVLRGMPIHNYRMAKALG
jgi:hypothetical protein